MAKIQLFSKMSSLNNIDKSVEEHLNFFATKDLFGTFENVDNIFRISQ